jgi:hypothetical protein
MNPNQHFFQAFFGPGGPGMPGMQNMQAPPPVPEYISYNETIFEIGNNWPFVRWLMCRQKEGWLKQMDPLEQHWMNFIVANNIDIESFKNNEEFIEKYKKLPI